MPAEIVFDHPGGQAGHSLGRLLARLAGSLLVLIGLLATVVAIPAGLVTLADLMNRMQPQPDQLFEPGFPLRDVEAAFAASLVVAVAGLKVGRRLVRGRRGVVLFLRRFGYDGSMQVVTFAVAHTIGVAWRLVTLDDAEIAPLGVNTPSRVAFSTGERLVSLATTIGSGIFVWFQWAAWGFWAVVGIQAFLAWQSWPQVMHDGTLDTYGAIYESLMEGHVPVSYFGPTLPGAFAIFGTAVGVGLIGLLVMMVVLLSMFPLFGFVMMATSSAEAVRKAEKAKTQTVTGADRVAEVARQVAERGRQTFAPRLMVLRVAGSSWQSTVSALAAVATATIIDISEPTENLAWEVFELTRLGPDRCIFIGDHDRIASWVGAPAEALPEGSLERRLARLIDARTVLAYTTDRRGMRRFTGALYGLLLEVPIPGT